MNAQSRTVSERTGLNCLTSSGIEKQPKPRDLDNRAVGGIENFQSVKRHTKNEKLTFLFKNIQK